MAVIVLIHGMWCHPRVAAPLAHRLRCEGHEVFCSDFRNRCDKTGDKIHSISDYVDAVEQEIQEQQFTQPPILVGHSMGGLIAQILGARIETSGLILLNSAAPAGINHIFWSSFRSSVNITLMPRFWRKANLPSLRLARYALFNQLDEETARDIHTTLRPESGRCFFEIVFWWLDRERKTRIETPIHSPMLIVNGGKDRIVHPRVARALAARYPAADWHSFNDCGHWIFHEESSTNIFDHVVRWIEGIDTVGSRDIQPSFLIHTSRNSGSEVGRSHKKASETTLPR